MDISDWMIRCKIRNEGAADSIVRHRPYGVTDTSVSPRLIYDSSVTEK